MKKTFRYLSMAALAVVAVVLTAACSNDDDMESSQASQKVITSKVTVRMGNGDLTRALTEDGVKTFAVGEQIAVHYGDQFKSLSEPLTSADIHEGGKSADFTVTMPYAKENTNCTIVYPAASMPDYYYDWNYIKTAQNGSFTSLTTNIEAAIYDGHLNGFNLPSPIELENRMAILKLKIKDADTGNDITSSVTKLVLISGGDVYYTVTPTSPLSTIYVAVWTVSFNLTFIATVGGETYTKTVNPLTLNKGKIYPINVSVVKQ